MFYIQQNKFLITYFFYFNSQEIVFTYIPMDCSTYLCLCLTKKQIVAIKSSSSIRNRPRRTNTLRKKKKAEENERS